MEDHLICGLINWLHEQWKGQIIQNFFLNHCKKKKQTDFFCIENTKRIIKVVHNGLWPCNLFNFLSWWLEEGFWGLMTEMNHRGLPWWSSGYESTCQCRGHRFDAWSRKIPHAAGQLSLCATSAGPDPRACTRDEKAHPHPSETRNNEDPVQPNILKE